jgi:hypothetical protein
MILANPIYDVVFKLLLNDLDVAKEFLSRIMGRTIIKLQPSSQEVPLKKISHQGETITLLRMDFSAVVLDHDSRETNVLIEIQKAKFPQDIGRFRNYLGEQYKALTDTVTSHHVGEESELDHHKTHLPIFTVYLLNFKLDTELPALVRVQREYKNAATEETLGSGLHDEFIESLTHDSFIAQIPKLPPQPKERLEKAFALFNQQLIREGDRHKLYLEDGTELEDDDLIKKMARILTKAVAESDVAKQMEHEDVLQQDIERSMLKLKKQISDLEKEKNEALSSLKSAYENLIKSGMTNQQALDILNLKEQP